MILSTPKQDADDSVIVVADNVQAQKLLFFFFNTSWDLLLQPSVKEETHY